MTEHQQPSNVNPPEAAQPPPPAAGGTPSHGFSQQPQGDNAGQFPQSAPPPPQPAGPGRPGELMPRFLARLVDGILLGIIYWILSSIITAMLVPNAVDALLTGRSVGGRMALAMAIVAILGAVINVGYFAFMESSRGQTLGKMILKLRVDGPQSPNPTLVEALKRNIWMAFGVLGVIPVIGSLLGGLAALAAVVFIAIGINNDTATRQGWHDTFAGGTRVVTTE